MENKQPIIRYEEDLSEDNLSSDTCISKLSETDEFCCRGDTGKRRRSFMASPTVKLCFRLQVGSGGKLRPFRNHCSSRLSFLLHGCSAGKYA